MTCKIAFFRICGITKTIRRYLSHDTAKTIVHPYITSQLDSCNALYYGLPKYLIDRLQLAQNSAARLVTASRRDDYITPILRRLHWLPVPYRIIFKILLLTYKALNSQAPSDIKDLLKYRNSVRVLRSSNKHLLNEPVAKLKTYGDTPLLLQNCGIRKPPLDIRLSSSVTVFKTKLKTYLSTNYFIFNFYYQPELY